MTEIAFQLVNLRVRRSILAAMLAETDTQIENIMVSDDSPDEAEFISIIAASDDATGLAKRALVDIGNAAFVQIDCIANGLGASKAGSWGQFK